MIGNPIRKVTMSAKTIRSALGQLQDDPENAEALASLRAALGWNEENGSVTYVEEDLPRADLEKLLEAARKAHEMRREYDAVASLLRLESAFAEGTANELPLLEELARVCDDELLDRPERCHQAQSTELLHRPSSGR